MRASRHGVVDELVVDDEPDRPEIPEHDAVRDGWTLRLALGLEEPANPVKGDPAFVQHLRAQLRPRPGQRRGVRQVQEVVLERDRVVVESRRPEELPIDLSAELHIRGVDRVSIDYRRLLGELAAGTF